MISGCFMFVLFSVLINEASPKVTVEAVIGGSVVLPCSSTEHDLKLQDTDVHWRHNGSKIVYDIVKGKDSLEKQDQQYKNRAETFPAEYKKGNFTLKLDNLHHSDAGEYNCLITPSEPQQNVQLIISETTAKNGHKPTDQGNKGKESGDVVTPSPLLWVYFVLPVVLVLHHICL